MSGAKGLAPPDELAVTLWDGAVSTHLELCDVLLESFVDTEDALFRSLGIAEVPRKGELSGNPADTKTVDVNGETKV